MHQIVAQWFLPAVVTEKVRSGMDTGVIHLTFLAIALAGTVGGLLAQWHGLALAPNIIWSAATVPVVVALTITMVRDFLAGRLGVDAIALVAMIAAIAMGEPLAGTVVAMMYTGGNLLEDYARGKAERDLRSLRDRTPRFAHRLTGGEVTDIAAEEIITGDELLVRAGELLPVDGHLLNEHAKDRKSVV